MGSPPQVRGKQRQVYEAFADYRITPAGAGKTSHANFEGADLTDHPRRCGENSLIDKGYITKTGSPPQVRGKLIFS